MGRIIAVFAFACLAAFGGARLAQAQTAPVMVELFTSQGCHSCPPADAYLGQLADRDDVIALSMHVDYWDYLGWRDLFGKPAHSERQRAYAAFMRERMVYTPQIVVQGREAMVGSHTVKVDDAIRRLAAAPAEASVALAADGDRLVAEIAPGDPSATTGQITMVWFTRAERVAIRAGENQGREITYHNVVTGWSDLGAWRGQPVALTTPKPMAADGVVVFVQGGRGGPILGAAKMELSR